MQRVTLIVNPQAGRGASFEPIQPDLLRILKSRDISVTVQRTTADPHSARTLASAAAQSADTVIACGGDGTVHGVVQGLAHAACALGVLPFGTANALARNLSLPMEPVAALRRLLTFSPRPIPLGCAETTSTKRYFLVMAGAGPDGTLVQEMGLAAKAYAGRTAYYTEAARLFATRRFPKFLVEYRPLGSSGWQRQPAVAVLASRVPDLGGLFAGLTTSCRLDHPHLLLHLLASPAHLTFPAWLAFGKAGLGRANPWLSTVEAEEVHCDLLHPKRPVYAQADAEPLGTLPLQLKLAPFALNLLMPAR